MKKALIILLVLLLLAGAAFGLYYFFGTAEHYASLGESAMRSGNYDRAVKRYSRAVALDPDNTDYALALADACIANGSFTQAERTLVNAIRSEPAEALYCKLSATYVAQDKLLDAQQMLDSVTDSTIRASLEARRPAAPEFAPESGEYDEYFSVTVTVGDAPVYVSTTDQYPSTASGAYDAPIPLAAGENHLSAIAVSAEGLVSPLATADYLIVGVVEEVQFTDSAVEALAREAVLKAAPTPVMTDDLWAVEELTIPDTVGDCTDLRYFTGLQSLTMQNSSVEDYSFLASMPGLKKLDLSGSLVSAETLSYIGGLTELTELNLSGCGLSNILPLASNVAVETLNLSDNSISNLGAISNYSGLKTANLSRNAITSVDALAGLTALETLDLSENEIGSVDALSGCTQMRELDLADNRISSIAALSGMRGLVTLDVSKNNLTDVTGLSICLTLEWLNVAENSLTNIDSAANLVSLTYLDFSYNQVTELPAFTASCSLQRIDASHNQLSDISGLSVLMHLNYVDVDYNAEVEDIECLLPCIMLVQVDAFGTKVEQVSALTDIGVVVYWDPTGTSVED